MGSIWGGAVTRYGAGAAAERRAVRDLEAAGYLVVRAAGSLGPLDLVAIGPCGVRAVQVKRDSPGRPLRPSELEAVREELRALPRPPGVAYELWVGRTVGRRWQWITREVVR
jgi:Holliday junction resolvase